MPRSAAIGRLAAGIQDAAVARDWEVERRRRSAEDSYRRMRARYAVSIEPALPAAQGATP